MYENTLGYRGELRSQALLLIKECRATQTHLLFSKEQVGDVSHSLCLVAPSCWNLNSISRFIHPQPVTSNVSQHLPGRAPAVSTCFLHSWRSLHQIFMPSFAFYGKDIGSIITNDNGEGCQQTNTHEESWVCGWLSRGCWPDCTSPPPHPPPLQEAEIIWAAVWATDRHLIHTQWYTVFLHLFYIPGLDLEPFCILSWHLHLYCEYRVWCHFPCFMLTSCCHKLSFLRFVKSAVCFFFAFFLWVV